MAQILIIGTATDGPSHQRIINSNQQELIELFGWSEERFTVDPEDSNLMLSYTPFSNISTTLVGSGPVVYRPYTSNASVFFGPIGYSASTHKIDIRYRPYLGKSDLLAAADNFRLSGASTPALCRIKGSTAKCQIANWEFCAQYAGAKYNNMSITTTSSTLTFSGMFPRYSSKTFSTTGNLSQLASEINYYNELGVLPFYVNTYSGSIPSSGEVDFTGGTDGEINSSTLQEALEMCVTTHTTHVLVLAEATSSLVNTILDYLDNYDQQPRSFFLAAPPATGTISSYISSLPTTLPTRSKWIQLVLGESSVNLNLNQHNRWNVESLLASYSGVYPTNKNLRIQTLNPVLTESELNSLYSSGIMAPVRKIGSGISIYKSCVSSADFKYPYASAIAIASSVSYTFLNNYFGRFISSGRNETIAKELESNLKAAGIDVVECLVDILDNVIQNPLTQEGIVVSKSGKHLNCQLTIRVFDEILSFNFVVKNR